MGSCIDFSKFLKNYIPPVLKNFSKIPMKSWTVLFISIFDDIFIHESATHEVLKIIESPLLQTMKTVNTGGT